MGPLGWGPWGGAPGDGAPGVGPLGPWGALGPQGGSLGRAPGGGPEGIYIINNKIPKQIPIKILIKIPFNIWIPFKSDIRGASQWDRPRMSDPKEGCWKPTFVDQRVG